MDVVLENKLSGYKQIALEKVMTNIIDSNLELKGENYKNVFFSLKTSY